MSLTSEGFARMRLVDIKTDLDARLTLALGPVNLAPDSVLGQVSGVISGALDDVWELAQSVYDASYPSTATGAALDGVVSYIGIARLAAAPTTGVAMVGGVDGTFVPAGAIMRANSGLQYITDYDVTITRANTGIAIIGVAVVSDATDYQIIAGGVSHTFNSGAGATANSILSGLAAMFDVGDFTATVSGASLTLHSATGKQGFTLTVGSKLAITSIASPAAVTCIELGGNVLPAGALNVVETVIAGWASVTNVAVGVTGRDVEPDADLRARFFASVDVPGSATVESIRARMLDGVTGATYSRVYENRLNVPAGLMPAHSLELVISGGADADVANLLWIVKPAGIETYGGQSAVITDSNGDGQIVYWTRPTPKYAWVRVTVTSLDLEEALDPSYIASIQDAVLTAGLALNIGNDIITQRFFGPVYAATPGLGSITIETAITDSPSGSPTYGTANIAIDRGAHALFDPARIVVVPL